MPMLCNSLKKFHHEGTKGAKKKHTTSCPSCLRGVFCDLRNTGTYVVISHAQEAVQAFKSYYEILCVIFKTASNLQNVLAGKKA